MTGTNQTAHAAYVEWTEHRFYAYRGCAQDPDEPRLAAGSVVRDGERVRVPLDAWSGGEDRDGGESQRARRVREADALEVCLNCPVMVSCDAYANSVTGDGRLAEPDGIRGGRTALERHRRFIARRHEVAAAAPDRRFGTAQKRAVLAALAAFVDPYEVAEEASRLLRLWGEGSSGMDVRTANWQRSSLVTLLNLGKSTATRGELLAEAVRRGLLDAGVVVADDGSVPAVPLGTPTAAADPSPAPMPGLPEPEVPPVPMPSPALPDTPPVPMPSPELEGERPVGPLRLQSPRRDRFADVVGQLSLWEAELAEVHTLFPETGSGLEVAA
jgi:hypothetical protein